MNIIKTQKDVAVGLEALKRLDPDLIAIINCVKTVPLRREQAGFSGLARIIIGQHVSTASAAAIHARFIEHINPVTPEAYLSANEATRIEIGLTRAKQATLQGLSKALLDNTLNLDDVSQLPAEEAIKKLTSLKGIGPWTAEVYLLFCAGHPDIFAAGDLAIREAVRMAYSMPERPSEKHLRQLASKWSPQRGIATRLFWSYYEQLKGRGKGLPL